MNYGVITYRKSIRPKSTNWSNIGDPIQSYAAIKLLERMGIKEECLTKINRYDVSDYKGDEVKLLYNGYTAMFNQYMHKFNSLPVPQNIIPVFTSILFHNRVIDEDIIAQLKEYSPIGARDEETYNNLKRLGVESYISGCVTATLPRRTKDPSKKKVFLVDVPESLIKHIPNDILEISEKISHQPFIERLSEEVVLTEEEYERYYNISVEQLLRYRDEATLVVTSRLHAASPCMAMGVPVIVVGNYIDGRFSWLDKYLHLYMPEEFDKIDWYPNAVEYEEDKELLIKMFHSVLTDSNEKKILIDQVHNLYINRKRCLYNNSLVSALKELNLPENTKYAMWGIRADMHNMLNVIKDYFPNWTPMGIIDENSTGSFEGFDICPSKEIEKMDKDIVYFVVPQAAHKYAMDYLDKIGRRYIIVKNGIELNKYGF